MTPTAFKLDEKTVQAEQLTLLADAGWTVMARTAMEQLRGPGGLIDAVVAPLLEDAIRTLNPGLDDGGVQAVVGQVRRINTDAEMLAALRDGVQYKPAVDRPTIDVRLIDDKDPSNNSYVATEEFVVTSAKRNVRLDVVCLVNGIPLGAIENKAPSEPLSKAADDWTGYFTDLPHLQAAIPIAGICNGLDAMIGPSGLADVRGYRKWTDAYPNAASVKDPDDPMEVLIRGAFAPHTLVDLALNFIVFETREGRTRKVLAQAHQYRAARKLVQRVLDGTKRRGLIWHATGSGKSLTMIFAARMLMRAGLGNPTVLLVIDRVELDEQINETLVACQFDGVKQATSGDKLNQLLSAAGGGVIVTTVHKFNESIGDTKLKDAIVFADEAHRSQFGDMGMRMRDALPDAFLFGFTGTPVEAEGRSTRMAFSLKLDDGTWENYLDRYGFDQAVREGATVPVAYERRLADWHVADLDVDDRFQQLTATLDPAEREALKKAATREQVVIRAPARIGAVAADVAQQLRDRICVNGYVGQLVADDREMCARYADALAEYLQPQEYAVIMSRSKKDHADAARGGYDVRPWYPAAHHARVHGTPGGGDEDGAGDGEEFTTSGDRAAIKDFIKRFKDPDDPLKLLIVNGMLLTGFDAPNEQALFMDRPLRGHGLIQAIARTNRRYADKAYGLIFDYWGVTRQLHDALKEFASDDLTGLLEDTDQLIERFEAHLATAEAIVAEAMHHDDERTRLRAAIRLLLADTKAAEDFEHAVKAAQSAYETLSPDPRLLPFVDRYRDVIAVLLAWRRQARTDDRQELDGRLLKKTIKLVHEAVDVDAVTQAAPQLKIDETFFDALAAQPNDTPGDRLAEAAAAVQHEITIRDADDPVAISLKQRLEAILAAQAADAQTTLDELLQLIEEHLAAVHAAQSKDLSVPAAAAYETLSALGGDIDEDALTDAARAIGAAFAEHAGFPGWQDRTDIRQILDTAVLEVLLAHPQLAPLAADPAAVDGIMTSLVARAAN
jgi:type I restriction enzyme, R subunit